MTVKQHACITLSCDACKHAFDGGGELRLHFDSIEEARSDAEEYDWFVADDGRALCGSESLAHIERASDWTVPGELSVAELERLIEVYPHLDPEEDDEPDTTPLDSQDEEAAEVEIS